MQDVFAFVCGENCKSRDLFVDETIGRALPKNAKLGSALMYGGGREGRDEGLCILVGGFDVCWGEFMLILRFLSHTYMRAIGGFDGIVCLCDELPLSSF